MNGTIKQSNGFLPLAPLMHAGPTVVGVWDLDRGEGLTSPIHADASRARDQLVLVRLHRQPLSIIHMQPHPDGEDHEGLLEAVWRQARDAIIRHISSCGCLPPPQELAELRAGLDDADSGRCPELVVERPHGRAAVILCTIGNQALLARSLESLAQMSCEDHEIVVVDNRPSRPGTRALVESFSDRARISYVAEPRPGLAVARNTGVAAAAGAEFVAFTDDDVVVDGEWLSRLLAPFADARVQATTGLVLPLTLNSAAEKRFEQYAGFGKGVRSETYDMGAHKARERFLYPYWGGMFGSGNSMAFRRESLLAVGGFDPALGAGTPAAGGEDLAAFTDVILAGGRLVYEPRSLCWHEHRGDEASLRTQVRNYGIGLTAVLWRYFRHDPRFSATLLRSLPSIIRLARSRSGDRQDDRLPADLARLELRGRLLGPWLYMISSRRARSSSRLTAEGGRLATSGAPQAGAQTRT